MKLGKEKKQTLLTRVVKDLKIVIEDALQLQRQRKPISARNKRSKRVTKQRRTKDFRIVLEIKVAHLKWSIWDKF